MPDLARRLTLYSFFCALLGCGGSADDTGTTAASGTDSTSGTGSTSGTDSTSGTGEPTTGPLPTTGNDTDPNSVVPCEAEGWTITPLAEAGISGALPALTTDSAGALHLLYASGYARRPQGGAWTAESIPELLTLEGAIAVDSAGGVHVATAQFQKPLRYLERTPDGEWLPTVQLEEDTSQSFGPMELVIDSDQNVHIVHLEPELVHWQRGADKVWESESPLADEFINSSSLALDGDTLRLCVRPNGGIRCLRRPAGGMWTETYDGATSVTLGDLALAIDLSGRHHILYADDATQTLAYINVKFLSLDGDPLSPVASGVLDTGVPHSGGLRPPKFAVDAAGTVHSVWALALGNGPPALRHARLDPGSNTWTISTIACSNLDGVALTTNAEGAHVVFSAYPTVLHARPDGG